MRSKVKEFSKGKPVTVETGGRPQSKERTTSKEIGAVKPVDKDTKKDVKPDSFIVKENVRE